MKDYIFIVGPSAVGKTTLAKKLLEYYKGVYIEQNMVPEFSIPDNVEDEGIYEEELCWQNTLMQIKWFKDKGYKNIIALDFDDLRVRELPAIFKGSNFIILKLISSDYTQIVSQMEKRYKENSNALYVIEECKHSNDKILNRPLLPNEFQIDVNGKNEEEVFEEAVQLIDNSNIKYDYEYEKPNKNLFQSWIQSYNLK